MADQLPSYLSAPRPSAGEHSSSNSRSGSPSGSLRPRPKFEPTPAPFSSHPPTQWIPVISAPSFITCSAFLSTVTSLALNPERNSGLILRADVLEDTAGSLQETLEVDQQEQELLPMLDMAAQGSDPASWTLTRRINLKLLPRKPNVDPSLLQECLFLSHGTGPSSVSNAQGTAAHAHQEDHNQEDLGQEPEERVLVMVPKALTEAEVPFYHPPVRRIAFHWKPSNPPPTITSHSASGDPNSVVGEDHKPSEIPSVDPAALPPCFGTITMSILPFSPSSPSSNTTIKPDDAITAQDILPNRLYRTCLHLLETVHKHGWGHMVGYKKRMVLDTLVPKEAFQDLYLQLKERHKHLDSRVQKVGSNKLVDVKRHVWKDVAIAAFLMLLWKGMYLARDVEEGAGQNTVVLGNGKVLKLRAECREWDSWGRPSKGFVDLGCGNALLVHILLSEGYSGKGIELRERKTWPLYPPTTRENLVEQAIDPLSWFPRSIEEWRRGTWEGRELCPIEEGMFLIGNHADEMTPWLPLFTLIPSEPIPYLSLPCCLHTLNSLFMQLTFQPPSHPALAPGALDVGFEESETRYKAYLKWLGWAGVMCGWKWEKEGLRIPSTRGWAIIGRERWTSSSEQDWECRQYVLEQVEKVRQSGGFTAREKEGKDPHSWREGSGVGSVL